jgi:hypothetical protein
MVIYLYIRSFEAVTAVRFGITVFCYVNPYRSVDKDQQFEKTAVAIFTAGESRHYSTLKMDAVVTLKYCSVHIYIRGLLS